MKRLNFVNMTLIDYVLNLAGSSNNEPGDNDLPESSYLVDCIFENLSGEISSAVSVYNSRVYFQSRESVGKITAFKNNISNVGSTLYSVGSVIIFQNITSAYNTAVRGGCIQIVSSEFVALNSLFHDNHAELGGVIFAIQSSGISVSNSVIDKNQAGTGSVIYSMANKISSEHKGIFIVYEKVENNVQPQLVFKKSMISNNWA